MFHHLDVELAPPTSFYPPRVVFIDRATRKVIGLPVFSLRNARSIGNDLLQNRDLVKKYGLNSGNMSARIQEIYKMSMADTLPNESPKYEWAALNAMIEKKMVNGVVSIKYLCTNVDGGPLATTESHIHSVLTGLFVLEQLYKHNPKAHSVSLIQCAIGTRLHLGDAPFNRTLDVDVIEEIGEVYKIPNVWEQLRSFNPPLI